MKAVVNMCKRISCNYKYLTNTPRVFHIETTWKRSFPRRFNVEYTWSVSRVYTAHG